MQLELLDWPKLTEIAYLVAVLADQAANENQGQKRKNLVEELIRTKNAAATLYISVHQILTESQASDLQKKLGFDLKKEFDLLASQTEAVYEKLSVHVKSVFGE